MKKFQQLAAIIWLSVSVTQAQAEPEFKGPGWFRATSKSATQQGVLDRSQAGAPSESGGGVGPLSLVSYPEIAEAITPEIQALARGLENDPKKIFDYVHDHIRYVHYFGSKKGAQLTLLERSGNDFDQSALLVALLRAAGQTASYRFGVVTMPYERTNTLRDFKHWLGLTKPATNLTEALDFAVNLNAVRGFPLALADDQGSDDLYFHRVWVRLTLSGTNYWLDPAFKIHQPTNGINLVTAMGLDTNQLMTAAGGTSNADYVVSLSEASLRNKLRDYTTNFLYYLQTNSAPNASVEAILGGQSVVSSVSESFPQGLVFLDLNAYSTNWDYIPTNLMTSLRITVDGTNQSLVMPQLQGQRLSLTFTTNGLGQLWLEDELLLQKQTSGGSSVDVGLSVDHPYGYWVLSSNLLVNTSQGDQSSTDPYQRTNASYAIIYAFEPDQEWLRQRQERLDRYRKQDFAVTSREIVTETLNVMGLNWMLQTERIPRVIAAQQNLLLQHHHRFGRMAQEFGKGYYIDVYQQLSGIMPASGVSSNDYARSDKVFDLENYFSSATEHGLIEQLQSSNLVAASTIKMLQIGNTNGQRTYLAKSSNWTGVQGNLSNYNLNFLKTNYIDRGYSLLLPANGSNLLAGAGSWAGYGLVARVASSTNYGMIMAISGGYHGGYSAYPTVFPNPPWISQLGYSQPLFFDAAPPLVGSPFGADPVNMADGSFRVTATDLSLGQSEPRGISFTRYYSSTRQNHNLAGMAHGWIHNYYLKADDVSAPLATLGDTTPAQMAAFVVATKSAFELYNMSGNPKNWAVTALIAKWGVDQMINNAVSVTMGDGTLQFIKQPDGSFTPPAKSTMSLLKTNGVYWVQERHGNTFKFNGTGWLTNIVDQYSQPLTLTYNPSNTVATVKDWKNRTLTLNYSGSPQRLNSISDGTRTVAYGYTTTAGQLDLTSVTDPESKTNTFQYDTNHQMLAVRDARGQLVTTNVYDAFGRVMTQATAGDTNQTWKLYWTGYVNTEENPAGGKRRFYYDDKRRLTFTQDALNHYNATFYDGQDHVIKTVSHLFAITDYYYDGRHNLRAILDPINEPKDFYYDAQDNLVHVWDERGYHSYFGYNARFQLTGSTNNAGDWVTSAYSATDGTLTSRTDPGGTTAFGYDSYGQLNNVTYPGSLGSEGYQSSSLGDLLSRTNARGFVSSFQYNQRRELTNTVAPTNVLAKLTYDAVGNLQSATDPRGFTSSNTWSATRKLLATTLPTTPQGVSVTTNVYDNRDWLARTINNPQSAVSATVSYTNDAAQRLVGVTDPLLRTTKFGYDDDNRKIATTNAAQEVTRQTFNARSELLQTLTPQLTTIKRSYDAGGNQITLTNRNGKKWQFQFDAANRLTNTVTPLNRQTQISYNNQGLVSTVKEPSTQTTTNYYDPKGRLTNSVDAVASRLFRYDANNNVTNIVEAGKTNTWTYDAYDRAQTYKDADGNLIQYRYDASGNLTNLIYPGNRTVAYAYDSLNRLTNVTDWANRQTKITYDLASRVTSITRPNGTQRTLSYDAAGQTTNIWERLTNGLPIAMFKLNYNAAARVEWEFAAPLPHAYTPPSRTMTFDDDNRIATFNGNAVAHDPDGNLTSGPLTNNTFVSYGYDAQNRLIQTINSQPSTNSYGYDPMGNRTTITNGANVTRLVVNPNTALSQVLMRTKAGVTNYYIYGLGLLYEITETATSTNTATYHYDYRGSTAALTDGNGNVTDRVEYSPYATTTYRSGTNDTPFLYNGRYGVQTDANGLLHMRARFYNPYLCRFLNADPSGFNGGLNFYAYADGNPVSMMDPFGLGAESIYEPNSWFGNQGMVLTAADALTDAMGTLAGYGGQALVGALTGFDNVMKGRTFDGSADSGYTPLAMNLMLAGATWGAGGFVGTAGRTEAMAAKTLPTPQYYIQEGVRRSVASREAGLTQVPATIFREGQAPVTTTIPLNQLFSPKAEIPLNSRFLNIQPPIRVPITVEPLGLPGQMPTTPISGVKLVP